MKQYLYPNFPVAGDTIVYQGIAETEQGTVTRFQHVETGAGRQHNRWNLFVDTATGPIHIPDYRFITNLGPN